MANRRLLRFVGLSLLLHLAVAALIGGLLLLGRAVAPPPAASAQDSGPGAATRDTSGDRPTGPEAEAPHPPEGPIELPERPRDIELFEKGE